MPFDEKDIPLIGDAEPLRSEPRGFTPEQMVTCEACLRANPPTRTSCLYCAAQLRATAASAALQKPTLRKLEKWEQGFNTIFLPDKSAQLTEESLAAVAELVRLKTEDLKRIVETGVPLPLAHAASSDEASLIEGKLAEMGVGTMVVADSDLIAEDSLQKRARAFELMERALVAHPAAGSGEDWRVAWAEIGLLVAGRLFVRQLEVEERKGRRAESEIVDAREMSADEVVLDIYTSERDGGWRIAAGNFDFSCLGAQKGLVASQNFSTLVTVLRERASEALYDDSYHRVRHALGVVWPLEQQTEARGWRRERPGRVHTEAITRSDNEMQFTRYSRLRHYLSVNHPGLNR
ncbi:MAG: hypothetical protein QOH63_3706 [Acidobacteriota bacterium]|nr:hypothetical protein [Acidobacteriota bacterium]